VTDPLYMFIRVTTLQGGKHKVDIFQKFLWNSCHCDVFILWFYNLVPRRCKDMLYRMFTAHQMWTRHTWLIKRLFT